MELRHLRYFVVTAETQHFTRAAEQLGIAQPPLSQQIRQLEEEIGTPLFHRVGRGVTLSDAGRAFLSCAQDILQRSDAAIAMARRAARGEVGVLNLGFTESASFNEGVTGVIRRYRLDYPDVEMNLTQGDSETLIGQLREGSLDAAFVRPPFALDGGIVFSPLSHEPLVVALPTGHALTRYKRLSPSHLSQATFILYSRKSGYGLSADILAACRQQGLSPLIGQRAPQLSSAVNLVAAGMGVAIVPASMQHLRPDGVTYRPFNLSWPQAILGLATKQSKQAAGGGIVEKLRQMVSEIHAAANRS